MGSDFELKIDVTEYCVYMYLIPQKAMAL